EADSDLNLFEAHETVVLADGTKRKLIGRVELLCRTTSISGRPLLFNSLFWIMEMSEDVKHSVILGNDLCKELDLLQDEVISAAEESEDAEILDINDLHVISTDIPIGSLKCDDERIKEIITPILKWYEANDDPTEVAKVDPLRIEVGEGESPISQPPRRLPGVKK
ncbi:hypothetical protein ADUPG1_011759, partial [Aduncisulcus paluster]